MPNVEITINEMLKPNQGRELLPAADVFLRRWYCCHTENPRRWLVIRIQFIPDVSCDQVEQATIMHPLCCRSGWAVAVFQMAIRRKLREFFGTCRLGFSQANKRVTEVLNQYFSLPAIDDYCQLRNEISIERSRRNSERMEASARMKAALEFTVTRQSRGLPACFKELGFLTWPSSEEAIKQRYRRMANVLHPDHGGDAGSFKQLEAAFRAALDAFAQRR